MGISAARIIGTEIDTTILNGNHAPFISVDALYDDKFGSDHNIIDENDQRRTQVIDKFECGPPQRHFLIREEGCAQSKFNYIKLKMYPNGGVLQDFGYTAESVKQETMSISLGI